MFGIDRPNAHGMIFRSGESIKVNSRNYDGSIRRSWRCDFVAQCGGAIDLVGIFEEAVEHSDLGRIEKGTVSHERFYLNRWYNYFRFEHPAGTLRNYYINICMPPTIVAGIIDYVDLDIDLVIWPDGRSEVLDLEEFEMNAKACEYPTEVQRSAMQTLEGLERLVSRLSEAYLDLNVLL